MYVVENLNFRPDEHSYVEPWVEPEDPNKKKQEEEEKNQPPPVDVKKLSPAERKKYEEEMKKKAEEEAQKPQPTQAEIDRELRQQKMKEEAAKQRAIDDYFDYKTTYKYLNNLQALGSVYVIDAPLATLTTSNSIAEVHHRHNVMGVKMTEEIRKLAQFYMKPFPLDVKLRHVKRPEPKSYFQYKSVSIIGGLCKNASDLLDKILLVNQLIGQNQKIYLVGEMGLAAVSALLEKQVCKVDHNELNYQDYARFFKMLFEKAKEKNCEIVLPVDFLTALRIKRDQVLA